MGLLLIKSLYCTLQAFTRKSFAPKSVSTSGVGVVAGARTSWRAHVARLFLAPEFHRLVEGSRHQPLLRGMAVEATSSRRGGGMRGGGIPPDLEKARPFCVRDLCFSLNPLRVHMTHALPRSGLVVDSDFPAEVEEP